MAWRLELIFLWWNPKNCFAPSLPFLHFARIEVLSVWFGFLLLILFCHNTFSSDNSEPLPYFTHRQIQIADSKTIWTLHAFSFTLFLLLIYFFEMICEDVYSRRCVLRQSWRMFSDERDATLSMMKDDVLSVLCCCLFSLSFVTVCCSFSCCSLFLYVSAAHCGRFVFLLCDAAVHCYCALCLCVAVCVWILVDVWYYAFVEPAMQFCASSFGE